MPETAPYPPLSPRVIDASGLPSVGDLRLRRFGTCVEDVQVDLAGDDLPHAITNILECCTVPAVGSEFAWLLPVGKRIECLLILAALDGVEEVNADLRCPSCLQLLEVALTIEELLEAGRRTTEATVEVVVGGTPRQFRRPTGSDQLGWMSQAYRDEETARRGIVASLAVTSGEPSLAELSLAELSRVEDQLDRADPLLRNAVLTDCPDCGHATEQEVDLVGFAVGRLRRSQGALLETVHLLATRYHWSEAEILRIPEWRRARYVAILDRETR